MRSYLQRVFSRAAETRQALEQHYRQQWLAKERAMEAAAAKRKLAHRKPAHLSRDCVNVAVSTEVFTEYAQRADENIAQRIRDAEETVYLSASSSDRACYSASNRAHLSRGKRAADVSREESKPLKTESRSIAPSIAAATEKGQNISQSSLRGASCISKTKEPLFAAAAACQYLFHAGFPLRAGMSFEEATKNHLQRPACIHHANQLIENLLIWERIERNAIPTSSQQKDVKNVKGRGNGRVFLAAFLVKSFPEYTLGRHATNEMFLSACSLSQHFERFVVICDTSDRELTLQSQAAALIKAWHSWKRIFTAWKQRDRVQLLQNLARETVELRRLRTTIERAAEGHSSAITEESVSCWTKEIVQWQEQLNELAQYLGGTEAQLYVERLISHLSGVAAEQPASPRAKPELTNPEQSEAATCSLEGWDPETLLAHEILVDLPVLRQRLRATLASACAQPVHCSLPDRVHHFLRRAYFDRFRENLIQKAYLPLITEAASDIREALLDLLPLASSVPHAGDAYPSPLHEQAQKYASEIQKLRATLERELDTDYLQQRLGAIAERTSPTLSMADEEESVLEHVAHELLIRIIFLALQVLFLVQMPAKDIDLIRAWSPAGRCPAEMVSGTGIEPPSEEQVAHNLQERIDRHSGAADAIAEAWEEIFALIEDRQRDLQIARVERWIPLVERFGPAREYAALEAKYPGLLRSQAWVAALRAAGISLTTGPAGAYSSSRTASEDSLTGGDLPPSQTLSNQKGLIEPLRRALVWTFTHPDADSVYQDNLFPEIFIFDRMRLRSWKTAFRALVHKTVILVVTRHWLSTSVLSAAVRDQIWASTKETLEQGTLPLTDDVRIRFIPAASHQLVSLGLDSIQVESYLRGVECACATNSTLSALLSERLSKALSAPSFESLSGTQSVFTPWHAQIQELHSSIGRLAAHLERTFGSILVKFSRDLA
jgi:hypothetical protein